MDDFKIQHFLNDPDYAGLEFPWFSKVSQEEENRIYKILEQKIGPKPSNYEDIFAKVQDVGTLVEGNAEEDGFNLSKIFESINIRPEKKVFVHWDSKRGTDEFYFDDLSKYLDDIWYPSADDIDIYDSTFNWIFSVDHHGYLYLLLLD